MVSERALIERIRDLATSGEDQLEVPIGDDAAVLSWPPGEKLVLAKDVLVEGQHFRRDWAIPEFLAEKSLAINLSDLAAMGSTGQGCLLGLTLPTELAGSFADRFLERFCEYARDWSCPLIGGDLSLGSILHISVTVFGSCRHMAWQRSGGRAGDRLLLVGPVGLSAQGLKLLQNLGELPDSIKTRQELGQFCRRRELFEDAIAAHLLPRPRLKEAAWWVDNCPVHAAIDVSDGLAGDCEQLAVASGLQAVLDWSALELLSQESSGRIGIDEILSGGEDYALILAVESQAWDKSSHGYPENLEFPHEIGRLRTDQPGLAILRNQTIEPFFAPSYDHFS